MSLNGLTGTLNILINDGETDTTIASIRNCTIRQTIEMLTRLNPDSYGWKSYTPGNSDWSASGDHVEIQSGGATASYLSTLQTLAFNKTEVTVQFTHDDAQYYTAIGYIDTWQIGGSDGDLFTGSFTIKGVTVLEHLDLDVVTPVIYMWLNGNDLAPLGGPGLYRQSIGLDDLVLIKSDANPHQYLTCVHKTRNLLYIKPDVDDDTLYQYDLETNTESVFDVITDRTGASPLRTQLDTTNDKIHVQVDKQGLERSQVHFYNFDASLSEIWTPVPTAGSGVNVDIAGVNPGLDEAYFNISAFVHLQSFNFAARSFKNELHRFTGANLGEKTVYSALHNEFYTQDDDGFVSRLPNAIGQVDAETKIQGLNATQLNQIYYSTYDDMIYVAHDSSVSVQRFDRLGQQDENLLGDLSNSDVACLGVCLYEPNLRE